MIDGVLFRFLVRRHRLALGLLALVPLLIGSIIGLIYPTFAREREMARNLLKIAHKFFGGEQIDILSAAGAFTLPFQHPLVFGALALFAAIPALALPAGERGRGGLDLLLATPLERETMVRTIAVFQGCGAPILGLSALIGSFIGAAIAGATGEVAWSRMVLLAFDLTALVLAFSALALLVSVLAADRSQATLFFGVGAFLAFMIDVASRLWRAGAWLGRLTPYGYMRPARVVGEDGGLGMGITDAAILTAAAACVWLVSIRIESRRNSV